MAITNTRKILYLPLCLFADGWSFFKWSIGRVEDEQDKARIANFFGFLSEDRPTLVDAWRQVFEPTPEEAAKGRQHRWKNVISEWSKIDGQRSGKFGGYFFTESCILWVLLAISVGFNIWQAF